MVSRPNLDEGLREGELIAEKYRLVTLLGEGGMGVVWAAEHVVTRRKVALKFLHARPRRSRKGEDPHADHARQRALREARASVAVAVEDARVVPIDDVLEHQGEAVLVMERLEGETLRQRLERDKKLPFATARPYLVALAEAIESAHRRGVVHRDLKPDNVFLLDRATAEVPLKVLDFGIAKLVAGALENDETPLTTTGAMMGTPMYMSPEQGFGESDVDERSDAWSFGVVAFEVLSGARPIRGENLGQVLKSIAQGERPKLRDAHTDTPDLVCTAVDALLVSDRERRGDLSQFLRAIAAATEASGPTNERATPAVSMVPLVSRRVGARPFAFALPWAALLVLLGLGGAAFVSRGRPGPSSAVAPSEPPLSVSTSVSPRGAETASMPPVEPVTSAVAPGLRSSTQAKNGPLPPTKSTTTLASASPVPSAPAKDDRGPGGTVVTPPF